MNIIMVTLRVATSCTDDQFPSYEYDYVTRDKLLLHELHRRIGWTSF